MAYDNFSNQKEQKHVVELVTNGNDWLSTGLLSLDRSCDLWEDRCPDDEDPPAFAPDTEAPDSNLFFSSVGVNAFRLEMDGSSVKFCYGLGNYRYNNSRKKYNKCKIFSQLTHQHYRQRHWRHSYPTRHRSRCQTCPRRQDRDGWTI